MKTKKLLSFTLAIVMLSCIFIMPANAAETKNDENIVIIIENNNISEKTREKIIAFYSNGGEEKDGVATYGLTCTLLGHKLETSTVSKTTHKVRSTSPRCLKETYSYSTCTRCDYEKSTLVSSKYIVCC